jgi:hypothetical protein
MYMKLALASVVLAAGALAYAAQRGLAPAVLPACVFAPAPGDHMAMANEHMRRAGAALALCNDELRAAAREAALAAAAGLKSASAPEESGPPDLLPEEPDLARIRARDGAGLAGTTARKVVRATRAR